MDSINKTYADLKMMEAFGRTLQENKEFHQNVGNDNWGHIWRRVTNLQGQMYDLPGVAIGREFVSLMATEWSLLASATVTSEKPICFGSLMLQY